MFMAQPGQFFFSGYVFIMEQATINSVVFMPVTVTMETLYKELKDLKKDVEAVKHALIPEEKVSAKELAEIRKTRKEMEAGKEKSFEEVFAE